MQLRIPEVLFFEEVGRGHGGVVYRGTFRDQPCRIKLPEERLRASVGAQQAFERDALQLARLPSTGLPRVLHLGAIPDTPYAILEAPRGHSLLALLAASFTEVEALQLALQLVQQLQQLHAAGFVHGDLSCTNIMRSRAGETLCLVDTGSVHRPIPFDGGADTRALLSLLQPLCARVGAPDGALARIVRSYAGVPHSLTRLARELCSGLRELTGVAPERATRPERVRSELTLLRRRWELTGERSGRVMVVLGAPGSGKSRLLSGFAEQLRQCGVPVLSIRCATSDWAPFSAIQRLLDKHLHDLAQLPQPERRVHEARLRAAAGPLASHLRLLSPELAQLFEGAQQVIQSGDAQSLFIAGLSDFLAKYLESTGRSAILVDDVQWLDASSRSVLSRLAARLCPQGHLLLCSARADEDVSESLERFDAMLPSGLLERLTLGPLSEAEACDVVAERLGLPSAPYAALVEPLVRLSDGTPLGLSEMLELVIEQRLLRPSGGTWYLESAPLSQLQLPASSRALIARRLGQLDPVSVEMLRVAAVVRRRFHVELLARVTGADPADVQVALDRAAGARLLLRHACERYTFVHDCVWEALLEPLPSAEQSALHQRVADALQSAPLCEPEQDYELARHLAAGILEQDPARSFRALARAGKRAITACDDALALSFLEPATRSAQLAGIELSRDFYLDLAEANLRTGSMKESLALFERALSRSKPGFATAHVRGRIAWLHHYDSNAQACLEALEDALRDCGRALPLDKPGSLLQATAERATAAARRRIATLGQSELETLCGLYSLCMRVAVENGRPLQGMSAALHMSAVAEQLAPCRMLVHAELLTAVAIAAIGRSLPWRKHVQRAQRIADDLADPVAQTLCHQHRHVICAWLGELEQMDQQARIAVDERGSYMELGELCHLTFGMYAAEIALGKPLVAYAWLERAITRVQQSSHAPAMFSLIEEAATTTLVSLGREQLVPEVTRRLSRVQRSALQTGSYFHLLSYQQRVQRLIDAGDLGHRFELLVREWQALDQNPQRAHPLVALYYVHVAHARVHQCLRAEAHERKLLRRRLQRALGDLEATARNRVFKAHASVTRAAYCFFQGQEAEAAAQLALAESLARETGCVWVSFAAARLHAHMLKARGKLAAARDEARIAAQIARRYGPRSRLRAICEEFELPEYAGDRGVADSETLSVRRHLDALLHIAQASSRELSPARQARFIVDELLETLAAERGFLFMREAGSGHLQCHAARRAAGQDLTAAGASYERALVEQVYATGQTLIAGGGAGSYAQERACMVVALVLREHVVGVLYLDRSAAAGSFSSDDVALIEALANQVPVVLELADSLSERERLEQNLRHAQKMEAIGRLAGGIAHDFNNILATIEFAASCLTGHVEDCAEEDLGEVRDAARRGAELTRQLLLFSRGKSIPPRHIDLVEVLSGIHPLLCRMVSSSSQIELLVPDERLLLLADPSQIERLLMNLCRNASDAMPQGGSITIGVQRAKQLPAQLARAQASARSEYIELCVVDRGTGMSEEVRARLFEPFFTTKPSQQGTGLGLAIVYAIVQQYAGHIEVHSELGAGSTFRVFLPLCPAQYAADGTPLAVSVPRFVPELDDSAPPTLLLVDDDDALRRRCERALEDAGYAVLTASEGEEALRLIADAEQVPQLAITDIHMPGMDGLALAHRLRDAHPGMRLLFISAEEQDVVVAEHLLDEASSFLQKPFDADALLQEIELLLQSERTSSLPPEPERPERSDDELEVH